MFEKLFYHNIWKEKNRYKEILVKDSIIYIIIVMFTALVFYIFVKKINAYKTLVQVNFAQQRQSVKEILE